MVDANLFISLFKLLDSFLKEIKPNDYGNIEPYQIEAFRHYQEAVFFFCLAWSVGAIINNEADRRLFDAWLRAKISDLTYLSDVPIPEEINGSPATIFDFQLKYDSYDVIKEKQQQTNDYSCDVQWVPWGQA